MNKLIRQKLQERYPDDPAIQKITLKEIDNVIRIYCNNIVHLLFANYIVPIRNYFMIHMLSQEEKKKKLRK
jgi:hypothetical protein